jgi:CRP-like cAMP-binding protein
LIRRFINDVPILRGLPVHEQYACAEGFREAVFRPGDVVARQGDFPDYFYILEEGTAKCTVHLPGESEQLPVAHYGRGSYFGELEFLGDVRKGARKAVVKGRTAGVCRERSGGCGKPP